MQHDGRHGQQAEQWPSFLGDPPATAQPPAQQAHAPSDGSGFRLPAPPQFAAPQQPAQPQQHPQFQYAPSPHAHPQAPPGYEAMPGYAPQDPAAAHPMHQPAGHAAGYAPQAGQLTAHAQPQGATQPHAPSYAYDPAAASPQHGGAFAQPGHQPTAQPYQHGAAAVAMQPAAAPQTFVAADGRTYAYATPQGFDLMQGANAQASADAVAAVTPAPASPARRMRWETIIPAAAAVLLLCTIALFVVKFDAITGRDQLPKAAAKTAEPEAAAAPSADDQAASLEQARSLANLGRYDEAKALVDPLLAVQQPLDGVAALSSQIETSSARNDELLALLGKQRQAGSWMGVVTTVGQIKALRPLTKDLAAIRDNAQARVNAAQRAKKRAKVTAAARRKATAAAKRRAAARTSARSAPRSAARPGSTARASTATPPARVGSGTMPPRPSVANTGAAPTGGGVTGGQPAVTGGGAAASCHTHEGVQSCH